ncbi:MAG: hypothetical protein KDA80_17335 [Planctomycetaceae bacterium]|nr:hypothetical protein [Planctomycetaceae bacterium]
MPNEHSVPSVPDISQDFDHAGEIPPKDERPDFHDEEWSDIPDPSELVVERHYTPGGEIEQIVHTEMDSQARASILAAQQRERDGMDENGHPLDLHHRDDYHMRLLDRFNMEHERDYESRMDEFSNRANGQEFDRDH